jgi:DNA invertase Pin-like site-specific DNA recombinase
MKRVALYARVSSGPQELSLDAQLRELREHAAREGLQVVEEVRDLAEKRHMIDRPGLNQVRDLAASGAIAEVWAVEFERFGEDNVPMLLAIELGAHGVRCRWPGDGGDGLGGEIMRAVAGVLSREEQRKRAQRSRRGKRDKARRGQVLGAGPRPRYGFSYVRDGKGRTVGYEVCESEMAIVRHIFAMLDAGSSIHAVQSALEAEGIEAPRGGRLWSRDTIKNVVREDTYRPHSPAELEALVTEGLLSEDVLAVLDPGESWGVAYYGRTRSAYESMRSQGRKVEQTPRSEWTAIPVPLADTGLDRGQIERARAVIANNKVPSKVGDYEYQLSRGFLFCAHCGRAMLSYARRYPEKGRSHYYYRCDVKRKRRGTAPPCPNRKSHRAEQLHHDAAVLFETHASRDGLLKIYDEAVAQREERTGTWGDLERRSDLSERLSDLELERRGYLRQNARGVLSDADLDAMLAEVDEQREAVAAELRASEDKVAEAERLRAARDNLVSFYDPVHAEWYEDPDALMPDEYLSISATPEEVRQAYRRFGARFELDGGGALTLRLELDLGGALHVDSTY